jgi:hypothetical protein
VAVPPLDAPAFVEALLDADVYRDAASSLADLRVRDGEEREVAYVLRRRETPAARARRDVPVLDLQATAAREARFTLDLGAGAPVHDRVWIRLRDDPRNFRVPVRVETSEDGRRWHLVRAAGFIYSVEGESRAADTSVAYPPATARYLRVTVGAAGGRLLPVAGAAVIADTPAARDEEVVPATVVERADDADARHTRLVLDLHGKRPVDRAGLDVGDATFHRVALVEAGDDRTTWVRVGSGALSAIGTPRLRDRQTTLRFPETTRRYLRLTVQNQDDRPLAISAVRLHAVRRGVRLPGGARRAVPPRVREPAGERAPLRPDARGSVPRRRAAAARRARPRRAAAAAGPARAALDRGPAGRPVARDGGGGGPARLDARPGGPPGPAVVPARLTGTRRRRRTNGYSGATSPRRSR